MELNMHEPHQNSDGAGRDQIRFENAPTLDLSIIIVSWNAKDYLVKCLKSLAQAPAIGTMEIIVVDNDSSDGSPEAVERDFPSVRLVRSGGNLGFARANNIGMRMSKGRYLALINSDVEVLGDCLGRLVDYCEKNPKVGMVGPHIIGRDHKLQRTCRGFPGVWNHFCRALALDAIFPRSKWLGGFLMHYWQQDTLQSVDMLTGCFWLARRQALAQVGLLDERFFMYGEDMDWCKRFWLKGWPLVFVPSAEAIHYGGASSANAPVRFYIEKYRAELQYWKKHHSGAAVVCFYLICCLHLVLRTTGYALVFAAKSGDRPTSASKVKRSVACLKWLLSHGTKHWNWAAAAGTSAPAGGRLEPMVPQA
jgi:GT2 family glycosyltransferase